MIGLNFTVENISTIIQVYDQIQIIKYTGDEADQPDTPVGSIASLTEWVTVSGTDSYKVPVDLVAGVSSYQTYDYAGDYSDWYSSRYYSTSTGSYSGWSDPILGETGDLYYDPIFPPEVEYGTADQRIIDRIRLYIGDPLGLRREYGEEALSSIHPDGRTYEMDEKGWPAYITMGGKTFTDTLNPAVNGYKLLKFNEFIDTTCTICSGITNLCGDSEIKEVEHGVDVYYYTFRHSDREIMESYDNCPPPVGLTETTATSSAYMLQTAIDLIRKELLEDAAEDGARIVDDRTSYDPSSGQKIRKAILDDLIKQLRDLVNSLKMNGITGVLID
jgi:hypothetical protein